MRELIFRFTFKNGDFVAVKYKTLDQLLDSSFALEQMETEINADVDICNVADFIEFIIFKDQYTGLKDKNNVDIFEGDLVTLPFESSRGMIFQVTYHPVRASFQCVDITDQKTYRFFNDGGNPYTVIGNIYENQDNLKDK